MADPWDALFNEAGLPQAEYTDVREMLTELRDAPLPPLQTPPLVPVDGRAATHHRRRIGWLPAVVALVALGGGGVGTAAALGALPDPVQGFLHDVSDVFLPFEFPEPEPETPVDVVPPGPPSGTPAGPPGTVVPGQVITPSPGGAPPLPPGVTRPGVTRPGVTLPDVTLPGAPAIPPAPGVVAHTPGANVPPGVKPSTPTHGVPAPPSPTLPHPGPPPSLPTQPPTPTPDTPDRSTHPGVELQLAPSQVPDNQGGDRRPKQSR